MAYSGPGQAERTSAGWVASNPLTPKGPATYTYGSGLLSATDSAGTAYYTRDPGGTLISQRLPNGVVYRYLTDGQGSVVVMVDSNGNVVATYHYCPTGNDAVPPTGSAAAGNPWRQGGNFYEPATQTYVLWNGIRVDANSGNGTQGMTFGPDETESEMDARAMNPPNGGLGIVDGVLVQVDQVGIQYIVQHLTRMDAYGDKVAPENVEMVTRLQEDAVTGAHSGGWAGYAIGADAAFYVHEVTEATLEGVGVSHDAAHSLSFTIYGQDPHVVYAPQVVAANPDVFNDSWFDFWGLPHPIRS